MPPQVRASSIAASKSRASHFATAAATEAPLGSQPSSAKFRFCKCGRPKWGSTQRPSLVGQGWVISSIFSCILLTTR